jgi:hypothetical protein
MKYSNQIAFYLLFLILLSNSILSTRVKNKQTINKSYKQNKHNENVSEKRPKNAPLYVKRFFAGGTESFFGFNPSERIQSFSLPMATYFKKFAKYAYCQEGDIREFRGTCPGILAGGNWGSSRIDDSVKIVISEKFKKVVFSCQTTETQRMFNIPDNILNTPLMDGFLGIKGTKILNYFNAYAVSHNLWESLRPDTIEIQRWRGYGDYQHIFVGHSVGGSVCNVVALKLIKDGLIKKTADSPVLITYGQPILGNDKLNELTEQSIPLIFKIVREDDAAATLPRYSQKMKNYYENPVAVPKHIGNFYRINLEGTQFETCFKYDKSTVLTEDKCGVSTIFNSYNHKFYMNDNLSDIDPLTEFNKVWDNASKIGANAYKKKG